MSNHKTIDTMNAITMFQLTPEQLGGIVESAVKRGIEAATVKQEMSIEDVADYMGVTSRTVRRMELRGELPSRIGRLWSRAANGWITLCELPFRSSFVATSPAGRRPACGCGGRRAGSLRACVRRHAPWHPRF